MSAAFGFAWRIGWCHPKTKQAPEGACFAGIDMMKILAAPKGLYK
jgi:hypothetical protein